MPEMETQEIRTFTATELRVEGEGKERTISGYAAIFNKDSLDLGGFTERIAPGAFAGVLDSGPDVRALVNHDPSQVLGRSTAGTLTLTENKRGLKVSITPPDTQVARDISTSIERGDVDSMSFGFRVGEDEWEFNDDPGKLDRRTVKVVSDLLDVSVVTFPAYPQTSVALRSYEAAKQAKQDSEKPEQTPIKDAARVELARRRAGQ